MRVETESAGCPSATRLTDVTSDSIAVPVEAPSLSATSSAATATTANPKNVAAA